MVKKVAAIMMALLCSTISYASIPEWKIERYTTQTWSDGMRDYNVLSNARFMGQEYLWPVVMDCGAYQDDPLVCGEYRGLVRAPCGGNITCEEVLVEIAFCQVEVTDCNFEDDNGDFVEPKVLKVYEMECLGTMDCEHERYDALTCCQLVGPMPSENVS